MQEIYKHINLGEVSCILCSDISNKKDDVVADPPAYFYLKGIKYVVVFNALNNKKHYYHIDKEILEETTKDFIKRQLNIKKFNGSFEEKIK